MDRSFVPLITGLAGFSFTLVTATALVGQSLSVGARSLSMSNATVATSGLPFEPVNPAVQTESRSAAVAFSFGQAHGLGELRYNSLAAAAPFRSLLVGTAVESFGFDGYRRTTASVVVSTTVSSGVRLGARLTGRHVGFQGYPGRTAAGISAGWTTTVSSVLTIGGMWRHIGAALNPQNRTLPQEIMFGFRGSPSSDLRIVGAIAGEMGAGLDLRLGVEARPTSAVSVGAGTGTAPHRISFGVGLHVDPGVVSVAASFHPVLGASMVLTVQLE